MRKRRKRFNASGWRWGEREQPSLERAKNFRPLFEQDGKPHRPDSRTSASTVQSLLRNLNLPGVDPIDDVVSGLAVHGASNRLRGSENLLRTGSIVMTIVIEWWYEWWERVAGAGENDRKRRKSVLSRRHGVAKATKTNLDRVGKGLAKGLEPHGAGNVDDATGKKRRSAEGSRGEREHDARIKLNVSRVLDVLLLFAVARGLLEGADDKGWGGGDNGDSGLTVLNRKLNSHAKTLPVAGSLGDVFSDLLGRLLKGERRWSAWVLADSGVECVCRLSIAQSEHRPSSPPPPQ
jgi:hypothetical protein